VGVFVIIAIPVYLSQHLLHLLDLSTAHLPLFIIQVVPNLANTSIGQPLKLDFQIINEKI
jgi:hypothetical protein